MSQCGDLSLALNQSGILDVLRGRGLSLALTQGEVLDALRGGATALVVVVEKSGGLCYELGALGCEAGWSWESGKETVLLI